MALQLLTMLEDIYYFSIEHAFWNGVSWFQLLYTNWDEVSLCVAARCEVFVGISSVRNFSV